MHHDFTSRSGLVLEVAGAGVGGSSSRQKLVAKHSFESEVLLCLMDPTWSYGSESGCSAKGTN